MLILISVFLYGVSDLRNIPDLVLGFNNRRDIVMNILFYSFWLGVIYWPLRSNNCERQSSLTLEDLMLRKYLEQRHIDLDSGRSCLALEREYWQALEVLAFRWPRKITITGN